MSAEHTRPPNAADDQTYSERQVAEILQRTARLERRSQPDKAALTLAEVEQIAREAGLDASLVRVAARSLAETEAERSLVARLAGARTRRTIERVIDGEIGVAQHEHLVGDLRAALASDSMHPPQISAVGRTLTAISRGGWAMVELSLTPREGKTLLRIEVNCAPMAGALFGGGLAGLGSALMPLAIGLAHVGDLGLAGAIAATASVYGGVFALVRGLFGSRARKRYREMEELADKLERRVREEPG